MSKCRGNGSSWLIVGALLFFGPSKIPELMRAVGRAWGEFRRARLEVEREMRDMEKEP